MSETYANIFMESIFASGNYTGPLLLLLLFLGRMLPIIALSPFFGARILPHPVKVFFAITLFVIFMPHLLVVTTTPINFNAFAIILLFKEMFVGFIIGFMISIPFTIVQTAGMIIDHQRGGASLMVNDPTIQNQSSPLGTMFNFVLIYLFFLINGPFLVIDAINTSFDMIPPDKLINPAFFADTSSFWAIAVPLLNKAMKIAAQLAAPGLLAILMTDVFLGIANRLAQQVQVTFLGLPLKSLLALTVICIGWKVFTEQMIFESYSWLKVVEKVIASFKTPESTA